MMKLSHKIMMLTLATTFPLVGANADSEKVVTKTTTMADGTQLTVTETKDVNEAADPVIIKHTTFSYDKNKNGIIEANEVNSYVTRYADKNRDGYIDESEGDSMTYFYNMMDKAPADNKNYTYWDKDNDKRLDASEIETLVSNTGIYKKWDTNKDGKIDSSEFAIATFKAYDDNGDGEIDINEWVDVAM